MLKQFYEKGKIEAGIDEAGRGPLAGPVVIAAVILGDNWDDKQLLNDSKGNLRTALIKFKDN